MNVPPEQTKEPLTQKNKGLLALVIFLGVLIVLATTVLIFVIVGRIIHKGDHPTASVGTVTVPALSSVTRPISVLQEPSGTHITQIVRQSDQMMVVSLSGGGLPDRIVIWDVANQQKLSEVKLSETPAKVGQ